MDIVTKAREIATAAHRGQCRRDGTAYITHPDAVAFRLIGESDQVIATAWLHDVIEDTSIGPDDLVKAGMPRAVVDAVICLTKRKGESYEAYLAAVRADPIARKVKVADMLHNLSDSPTERQIIKYAKGLLALCAPNPQFHDPAFKMKPKLTNIQINDVAGHKTIRLDFDNDRHHMSREITGDRDDVAGVLYGLIGQLRLDGSLSGQNIEVTGAKPFGPVTG